ncbi:hypothetical protein HPB52_010364 [Rhipicephalus sanguineus]|uniref:PPIase cyclophilin-type domain-containing protein n=1 Tax=Rhipicephalus sanguineus TaxID=34632 RepID=A0A9D4PSG7_RHISA|nr:hypothetical protein HPB52_010364 [Rhipicephalus sanguineus]
MKAVHADEPDEGTSRTYTGYRGNWAKGCFTWYDPYGKVFEDENFELSHNDRGVVSIESNGKKNNVNSRFYIIFAQATYMDKKHVVIGKVTEGLDVLQKLEEFGGPDGKPKKTVTISDCGEA